jgi:phosphoenolpyruvate carboxykinase (ATP)
MNEFGHRNPAANLADHGIRFAKNVYWNLSAEELVEHTIQRGLGVLSSQGAICINTGKFTGRAPEDRFIVDDKRTHNTIDWGKVNKPFDSKKFKALARDLKAYYRKKDIFIKDCFAVADPEYRRSIRVITELPANAQFAGNMFIRPTHEELTTFEPMWTVYNAPGFEANVEKHGTRSPNFVVVNFTSREVIIGGTGYTGEIKKSIFSILNFVLPTRHKVLPMHCSANMGKDGDVAIFFGLSGTGKTTLSADPNRQLIGDDEHGWSPNGIFNFEGGCYAKAINLSVETEPDIYRAIKHGAILENIKFFEGTRDVNYADKSITENTRVSYPIYHIDNALVPSMGGHPKNIFMLTADATGVLPPISKLTPGQAMYHFISGYTAKIPGTEQGVVVPKAAFSACFGAPFMPLHPAQYGDMLGKLMRNHKVNVWLINTGWAGGSITDGASRIKLRYTRAMITAALEGQLDGVAYQTHDVFGLQMPTSCPNVPDELLNPRAMWADKNKYDQAAHNLAEKFVSNFDKYADQATEEMLAAAPKVMAK